MINTEVCVLRSELDPEDANTVHHYFLSEPVCVLACVQPLASHVLCSNSGFSEELAWEMASSEVLRNLLPQ